MLTNIGADITIIITIQTIVEFAIRKLIIVIQYLHQTVAVVMVAMVETVQVEQVGTLMVVVGVLRLALPEAMLQVPQEVSPMAGTGVAVQVTLTAPLLAQISHTTLSIAS
jgi:hypothetical protein